MSTIRTFALLSMLGLVPVLARAEWHQREEAIMATRVAVELWSEDAVLAERAMSAVIDEMRRTDELMSTYKPESQLSQVNAHAFERPVKVDRGIIEVVTRSFEFSRLSGGAFDVTYASVGYLYDYRARRHPSEAQIEAALPAVDWRQVQVDPQASSIRFLKPGMRIDLGGIAKGSAVDRGIVVLQGLGITRAMVNAGGDTRITGDRFGRPWVIGIRHPPLLPGSTMVPAAPPPTAASTALPPAASMRKPACSASGCEVATTLRANTGTRTLG